MAAERIILCGDSEIERERLMAWCEDDRLD